MTFTSADAIQWLVQHVDGVNDGDDAIIIMEKMLSEKKICHASGDFNLPFIVGFYFYHVCPNESDSKGKKPVMKLAFEKYTLRFILIRKLSIYCINYNSD